MWLPVMFQIKLLHKKKLKKDKRTLVKKYWDPLSWVLDELLTDPPKADFPLQVSQMVEFK